MDLLLTHGFFLSEDAKEQEIMKPYAPLGLLYLSSYLRAKGFDVAIYDSTFGSLAELLRLIDTEAPPVVGIYGNLMTRANVLRIAEAAKVRGCRVVLGGPEPPNYPSEYLLAGVDAIVNGEGERVLEKLLHAFRARADVSTVEGIQYLAADGTVARTPPPPLLGDLDAQPWPDRERVDISRYLSSWRGRHGTGSVTLITSRGCPYHCRWCSHSTFGKTHRRRSPVAVADEVSWIVERYAPDMLWMADDVFTIHHGWIQSYEREMNRRGLRIPFECITRADRTNTATASALASLGCFRVWIGSESGSQRILDRMERGVRVQQVQEAVAMLRDQGIQSGMFLMWGYEGEELSDIEATVNLVRETRPDIFLTTISYPIKGTPYHEEVASRLVPLRGWADSTDREVRLKGRHSRRFYGFADHWLKSEASGRTEDARAARQSLLDAWDEVEA